MSPAERYVTFFTRLLFLAPYGEISIYRQIFAGIPEIAYLVSQRYREFTYQE